MEQHARSVSLPVALDNESVMNERLSALLLLPFPLQF